MSSRKQSDEDLAQAFAIVTCLFGTAVWLGYLVFAIPLGLLLALAPISAAQALRHAVARDWTTDK